MDDHLASLLDDVLTLLCFLISHDIAPSFGRLLPPWAVRAVAPLLLVQDAPSSSLVRSELQTQRMRFVHFLCYASGLVAVPGNAIKPTPLALQWLSQPPCQQAETLFHGFRPTQDGHWLCLWRTFRMPGGRSRAAGAALDALLQTIGRAGPGEVMSLHDVSARLAAFWRTRGDGDAGTSLAGILELLVWFGAITRPAPGVIRLTTWGAAFMHGHDTMQPPPEQPRQPLTWAGDLDLVSDGDPDPVRLYEVSRYASLVSVQPGKRRLRLDRELVSRAIEQGETPNQIMAVLQHAIGDAVPAALASHLQRWAADRGRVTVQRATLLEVDDASVLQGLMVHARLRACIHRTLSPRAVIVREDRVPQLIRCLERHGIAPRVDVRHSPRAARRRYDEGDSAHLYLAARMAYALGEHLPARYRVPYSLLLDMEKRITERDRTVIQQIVRDWVASVTTPPKPGTQPADDVIPAPVDATLALIEQAIAGGDALEIVYYTAGRDATTSRIVEPLRVERRRRVPYLIAYCRLRGDERVFRVDRIRQARLV